MKKMLHPNIVESIQLLVFALLTVLGLIFSDIFNDSNNYIMLRWIVIACIVVYLFMAYCQFKIINHSYGDWTNCPNFPNENRICYAIAELVNSNKFIKEKNNVCFKTTEPDNETDVVDFENSLYSQYLDIIRGFIKKSRRGLSMTLLNHPYAQIDQTDSFNKLNDSIEEIKNQLHQKRYRKNKKYKRNKIVILNNQQLTEFQDKLFDDIVCTIENNHPQSKFENYLELHKDVITLRWETARHDEDEEFIVIDKVVCLIIRDQCIEANFSEVTIKEKITRFQMRLDSEGRNIPSTKDFLQKRIIPDIEKISIRVKKPAYTDQVLLYLQKICNNLP